MAELCRSGRTVLDGAGGGRVRLYEPHWQEDPVDFLTAASAEFAGTGVVLTARRCLATIETSAPLMFVGVELSPWDPVARTIPMDALARALGRADPGWPVNLVFLDAAKDPITDWLRERVRPFDQHGY